MSQSNLLTEEEVRTHVNECFNLKCDRESFMKPTKEFVIDMYSRFLDYFHLSWRPLAHEIDVSLKARMVGTMRSMFSKYNISMEFSTNDLLTPNRKRTNVFMNLLIYIKAKVDEALNNYIAEKKEWLARRQEVESIKQEINQLKLEIEDMAVEKSNYKSIEELRVEVSEKRRYFEKVRDEGGALSEEAKVVKSKIKIETELLEKEESELEVATNRYEERVRLLQLLESGRGLKKNIQQMKDTIKKDYERLEARKEKCRELKMSCADLDKKLIFQESTKNLVHKQIDSLNKLLTKIEHERAEIETQRNKLKADELILSNKANILQGQLADLEREKTKRSLQNKIKLEQASLDLQTEIGDMEENCQQVVAKIAIVKNALNNIKAKRTEIATKLAAVTEKNKAIIDQSNHKLNLLKKRFHESKENTSKTGSQILKTQAAIDALIGKPKEIELPAANRTYIKESGDTEK